MEKTDMEVEISRFYLIIDNSKQERRGCVFRLLRKKRQSVREKVREIDRLRDFKECAE